LVMFAYIFLVIASLLIIKPVSSSLFLVRFGVEQLPYVFVLVALFAAIAAAIYSRFAKNVRINYLIFNTNIVSIASLIIFWFLLRFSIGGSYLYCAFYIWAAIFGVITSAQFWLLANYIFNAREAKRLFGFIGAGAISGGIFGGYPTNFLAPRANTENLLFFSIGFLLIRLFLLRLIWIKYGRYKHQQIKTSSWRLKKEDTSDNPVKLILNSRHLTYAASLIATGIIAANLADYQFSAIASKAIGDPDRLTAFFGFWMSNLNIASLAVQLLLTRRILKHSGVITSLFFLPLGLLVGAAAVLFAPGFWSAILIKVCGGSFKHSINKSSIELLFLPIPLEIKNRAKSFIDIFLNNLANGIAGIILILLTIVLDLSVSHLSLVIVGLVAVWIFFIIRVKAEYADSFRQAIERRTIDLDQQSLNLQDASVMKSFLKVLDGNNERQILYILNLLEDSESTELVPYLKKLIAHPSNEVKACVLTLAFRFNYIDLSSEAKELIENNDLNVRIKAINYLCKLSKDRQKTFLGFLNHDNYLVNGTVMLNAAYEALENKQLGKRLNLSKFYKEMFEEYKHPDENSEKQRFMMVIGARIIGIINDSEFYPYLHRLIESKYADVQQAAIISAGKTRSNEFIPSLLSHLKIKLLMKSLMITLKTFSDLWDCDMNRRIYTTPISA